MDKPTWWDEVKYIYISGPTHPYFIEVSIDKVVGFEEIGLRFSNPLRIVPWASLTFHLKETPLLAEGCEKGLGL